MSAQAIGMVPWQEAEASRDVANETVGPVDAVDAQPLGGEADVGFPIACSQSGLATKCEFHVRCLCSQTFHRMICVRVRCCILTTGLHDL